MEAWEKTLQGQSVDGRMLRGSFRGVPFVVPESRGTFGRRTQLHEYPERDRPWVEDLGKAARKFTVQVFIDRTLDADYTNARDALIAALEAPGPGTLIHPWYGTMRVSLVEPGEVEESTRSGGRATFNLTFIESGELRFPTSAAATAQVVQQATEVATAAVADDMVARWAYDAVPASHQVRLADDLYATLSALELEVAGAVDAVAAAIRTPAEMAGALVDSARAVIAAAGEPLRAAGIYAVLFNASAPALVTPTSANRLLTAQSQDALRQTLRRTLFIELASTSASATWATRDDALGQLDTLAGWADALMEHTQPDGTPIDDTVYQALSALRVAISQDLRTRGARLPELREHTLSATLPALVVAHALYGDATRADELIARNGVRHPGAVPGGIPLEVLSE